MVKGVENSNLFHDAIDIVPLQDFVYHFNGDLDVGVVLVVRLEYMSKRSSADLLCRRVKLIVLSQLCNTLLIIGRAALKYLPLNRLDQLVVIGRFSLSGRGLAFFSLLRIDQSVFWFFSTCGCLLFERLRILLH